MAVPIDEALRAVKGEPVAGAWSGREGWKPGALISRQGRRGSANHSTIGWMGGFFDALNPPVTADKRSRQAELLDWLFQAIEAHYEVGQGLMEGPHSRIYHTWQFVPYLAAWCYLSSIDHPQAERLRGLLVSNYAELALCTEPVPARGFWRSSGTWSCWACAAAGARSFSDENGKYHHIDEFQAGGLLEYELREGRPQQWEGDALKALDRRFGKAPRFLSTRERGILRSVVESGERVDEAVDLITVRPAERVSYLRWPNAVASVLEKPFQSISTSPLYGCLFRREKGRYEILAADPSARNRNRMGSASVSADYEQVTAARDSDGNQAPGDASGPLRLPGGKPIYHVRVDITGARLVGEGAPAKPPAPPPGDEDLKLPATPAEEPVALADDEAEVAMLHHSLRRAEWIGSQERPPMRDPAVREAVAEMRRSLENRIQKLGREVQVGPEIEPAADPEIVVLRKIRNRVGWIEARRDQIKALQTQRFTAAVELLRERVERRIARL